MPGPLARCVFLTEVGVLNSMRETVYGTSSAALFACGRGSVGNPGLARRWHEPTFDERQPARYIIGRRMGRPKWVRRRVRLRYP
jgi:hypothetical protein